MLQMGGNMKLLRKAADVFDGTVDLLAILAGAVLGFLLLIIVTQVTLRIFGLAILWIFEISKFSLLYITFLGTAWLLKKDGHVKMDIVLTRFSPRTQSLMNIITSILGVIICLVITWYGVKLIQHQIRVGDYFAGILEPPKWPIVLLIPLGTFLLFIQFLRRTYGYLRIWEGAKKLETRDIDETVSL